MTDEYMLHRLKAGQQIALEEMMEKYHRYVYTIIAGIIGSTGRPEDVEELVQDTFYAVWDHAEAIHSRKLKAYLGSTARNKAKNWLRGRRELPMALDSIDIPDINGSLEDAAVQAELARSIRKALKQMRPKDTEIFLRHYYYLQTAETIAAHMGIPTNTVLSRLARGRKILRKTLSKEDLF